MTDRQRHACAVCGRVLNYAEGQGWIHPFEAALDDHPVVPVRDDEITPLEKCDFCYADSPGWEIPVRSFQAVGAMSGENWAACDECAKLIARNQWTALVRRVTASWESRHGHMDEIVGLTLRGVYRTLRRNLTGPPRRR